MTKAIRILAALLALAACHPAPPRAVPAASPAASVLHDLQGTADLARRFDADADRVRLVLLVSPT